MSHQIFNVYRYDHQRDRHQLIGSVMKADASFDILADYFHQLGDLTDPQLGPRLWESLNRNPYFRVVDRAQLKQGLHPDLVESAQVSPAAKSRVSSKRPDGIWEYTTPILGEEPQLLEWRDGTAHLNGDPLDVGEATRLVELLRTGKATIRYRKSPLQKMMTHMQSLSKVEPHLASALDQLRESVRKGHVHPDVLQALSREIFVDPMTPGIGNKKAFADFLERPRAGVHIRMDGNDFGQINKLHSHEHGDQAIKAMGAAMRETMDTIVGRGNGKLFRIGGDEFHAHVPDVVAAAKFARALREKMAKLPPAGGTHNLSVSMGFGADHLTADQALLHAKTAKKAQEYPSGQSQMHVHSLLPGEEGEVPVSPEKLTLTPAPSVSSGVIPQEPEGGAAGGAAPASPVEAQPRR